jgi:hypothetical protein
MGLKNNNNTITIRSVKDQLRFLVTIILGGDSFLHKKQKTPKSTEDRHDTALRRKGATQTKALFIQEK